jgi:hypothetical protein
VIETQGNYEINRSARFGVGARSGVIKIIEALATHEDFAVDITGLALADL